MKIEKKQGSKVRLRFVPFKAVMCVSGEYVVASLVIGNVCRRQPLRSKRMAVTRRSTKWVFVFISVHVCICVCVWGGGRCMYVCLCYCCTV